MDSIVVETIIARSKLTFDKAYYSQFYSDWKRTRSKFRKFAVPLGVIIVVAGFVISTQVAGYRFKGIAVIGFGIFQLIDALTYRSRWIKKRLEASGSTAAQFEFYKDRIHMKSDSSEGHFLLSGFVESTSSDHGVFLVPQKGLSFYIPWASIEPADALCEVKSLLEKEGE